MVFAPWGVTLLDRAVAFCSQASKSEPKTSKIDLETSKIDPRGSKIDPQGSQNRPQALQMDRQGSNIDIRIRPIVQRKLVMQTLG